MTLIRAAALAAALLIAAPALAQTAQDQDGRRPNAGAPWGPGSMMGPGGMMGGDIDIMRHMMGMGMMGAGMRPGAEHIEGRLAFLKTELKITDSQTPQWNAFAEAVRANAKTMGEMHQQMMSQAAPKTLPERLALERKAMTGHLEALNRTTDALDKLYEALSVDQKKVADEIIVGPMGMPMGMM
jgi:LTXXQ motif family protein